MSEQPSTRPKGCCCAYNTDGTVTTFMCPQHADADPCETKAMVTGLRRTGSVGSGTCSACGWTAGA